MGAGACGKGSACGCTDGPGSDVPADAALDTCSGGEAFALRVLGDSMEPEFREGEIIVIEPEGLASDQSFVLAWHAGGWIFRQLSRDGSQWRLKALNPAYPEAPLINLAAVRGVVIQKAVPGRRRESKRYV